MAHMLRAAWNRSRSRYPTVSMVADVTTVVVPYTTHCAVDNMQATYYCAVADSQTRRLAVAPSTCMAVARNANKCGVFENEIAEAT